MVISYLQIYNFLKEHKISKTQMDLIVDVVRKENWKLDKVLKDSNKHWSELNLTLLHAVLKEYEKIDSDILIIGGYCHEPIGLTSIMYVKDVWVEEPKATYVLATKEEISKIGNDISFTKEELEEISKRKHYTFDELVS